MENYKKTHWYNIEDFYLEYPEHELAMHLQEKYEQLIREHGYNKILHIEELLEKEMLITEETLEARKKAISKLSKKEIFEVISTLAFLSGIATGLKSQMDNIV